MKGKMEDTFSVTTQVSHSRTVPLSSPSVSENRLDIEAKYHDDVFGKHTPDLVYGLGIPPIIQEYVTMQQGCLNGRTVIEIGCGAGENLISLASRGAEVWGIDISREAIEHCRRRISSAPFASKIHLAVGDAHNLPFADGFADLILGNAILHHLDLDIVCGEMYRCLKPGGKAVFNESLGHNPFINLFRKLTPKRRTPTEKPLKWSDIGILSRKFRVLHREFFCLPLIAFLPGLLGMRRLFTWTFNSLFRIEHWLRLDRVFRRYCWITVLQMYKDRQGE